MGKTKTYKGKFLTFYEARKKARTLGLKSEVEWRKLCSSKDRPLDMPVLPRLTYKEYGWTNNADFFGYTPRENYLSFEQAREFVRSLGFKKTTEWKQYLASGNPPPQYPFLSWGSL